VKKSHAGVIMTRPEVMLLLMKIWGWFVQMYENKNVWCWNSASPKLKPAHAGKMKNACSCLDILIKLHQTIHYKSCHGELLNAIIKGIQFKPSKSHLAYTSKLN